MVAISSVERRRLLVTRQLLGPGGRRDRSIGEVTSALALLHSTDPSTPYLSIHARSDASIDATDDALYGDDPLVRCTTIRRTVFVMDCDAARSAHGAFNTALADKLRAQLLKWLDASDDVDGPADRFLDRVENAVVDSLRADGPATGSQIAERVPDLCVRVEPQPGATYSKPIRITSKVLELLGVEMRIVRGRPTGDDFTSGAWTWKAAGASGVVLGRRFRPGRCARIVAGPVPDVVRTSDRHRHDVVDRVDQDEGQSRARLARRRRGRPGGLHRVGLPAAR